MNRDDLLRMRKAARNIGIQAGSDAVELQALSARVSALVERSGAFYTPEIWIGDNAQASKERYLLARVALAFASGHLSSASARTQTLADEADAKERYAQRQLEQLDAAANRERGVA